MRPRESDTILVIVPCGQQKIWDKRPNARPTPARDAYTGAPFVVNRAYAERFAIRWVILSAKYGLIPPDFVIPGPYNVTFKKPSTNPISVEEIRSQIRREGLDRFQTVIGLGGIAYRKVLEAAYAGIDVKLMFPFGGLPLGKGMRAVKDTIASGAAIR